MRSKARRTGDLWGTNVSYGWAPPAGVTVTYTDGTTANSLRPAFIVPATGEDVTHAFRLTATGGGGVAATSSVNVRVAAGPRVENVEFVGTPRGVSGGRTVYAQGEDIEVALRFDRAVTVDTTGGEPSVEFTVGTATRTAQYRRGTRSRQLVFGYQVVPTESDGDGVDLVENSLALNGAEIVGVSDSGVAVLSHMALEGGADRRVAGNVIPQGSGISRAVARGTGGYPGAASARHGMREGDGVAAEGPDRHARRFGASVGARAHDGAQGWRLHQSRRSDARSTSTTTPSGCSRRGFSIR